MLKQLRHIAFFFSLLLCTQGVQGQAIHNPNIKRTWHWRFGYNAGLDFNTGHPVVFTGSAMQSTTSTASISDTAGNLLFYTHSGKVWNKNNVVMTNGTGLCPDGPLGIPTMLALPKPDSSNIFYIFSLDFKVDSNSYPRWVYAVINMTKDGGLGAVVSKANFLLSSPVLFTEKIAAIPVANERAYWIITMQLFSDTFYVYKFNDSGISSNPVISAAGRSDTIGIHNLIVLNNRRKLVVSINAYNAPNGGLEFLDFNDTTGIISNPLFFSSCYCEGEIEATPDDKFLYDEVRYFGSNGGINGNALYQYNLKAGSPSAIIASKTRIDSIWKVDTLSGIPMKDLHLDLQYAPDGKIYTNRFYDSSLGVINYPDSLGLACDNVDSAISLSSGYTYNSLCYFPDFWFYDSSLINSVPVIQPIIPDDTVSIYPNPNNGVFVLSLSHSVRRLADSESQSILQIYNILGKKVYDKILTHIQYDCHIELSNQPNGIYLYRLISTNGKQIATGKFVIQKQQ